MSEPRFIHLRLHSAYSLLEGAVPVKTLPELCAADGMPAVALTDTGNLFAALEFSEAAAKAKVPIQPIIGCQLDLAFATPAHPGDRPPAPRPVVLLAQDETGFGNLMKLSSLNYLDCGAAEPHVTLAALEAHAAGLICLTGGADGPLGALLAEGHGPRARALAERLAGIFPGRLYVEIQRHPLNGAPRTPAEAATEPGLVGLAYDLDLPLVATNDVHFPARDLYDAHDALICIADGAYVDQQEARRRLTPEHYFKSQDEMLALFADLPEAVANTVEIARRCAFRPKKRKPILPRFADDEVEELRRQARAGLDARLAAIPHSAPLDTYRERLEFELGVIEGMGFPGYFLIVADFIKWAKQRSIPVGPGRGSGRRLARRLRPDHHRPRPAALRPALRALPEPRPHLDAGLRHRLLHGPPRGGDRLRPEPLRPRPGGADHHLRRPALQGRGSRRRPGAADALRPGRPALEADPDGGGEAGLGREGARRGAAAQGGGAARPAGRAPARDRPGDRGPAPQRLDPRRRRRHRRPAA